MRGERTVRAAELRQSACVLWGETAVVHGLHAASCAPQHFIRGEDVSLLVTCKAHISFMI